MYKIQKFRSVRFRSDRKSLGIKHLKQIIICTFLGNKYYSEKGVILVMCVGCTEETSFSEIVTKRFLVSKECIPWTHELLTTKRLRENV